MPTLTRWFLRAALLDLVAGLALGIWLAVSPDAMAGGWRLVYVHLLVMGWATQMIFGVAYWMFPRKQPLDLDAFDALGWTCFVGTNLGLVVRAVAEPYGMRGGMLAAAALQLLAVLAFVVQIWPRVTTRPAPR